MIDLDAEELRIVKDILLRQVPLLEVLAFGSRVVQKAGPHSDLDLAIVSPDGLDWRTVEALKNSFAVSELTIRVDVVDFTAVSPRFQEIISQQSEVIQPADANR